MYFCPHSFEIFLCQDKQKPNFNYIFPYFHYECENNLLKVCLNCYLQVDSVVHKMLHSIFYRKIKEWLENLKKLL